MATPTPSEIASVSTDPDVQEHYAAQVGVTSALVLALRKLWSLLTFDSTETLQATMPDYISAVQAVVQEHGAAAAYLAAENFKTLRANAGITDPFRPPLVDPPPAAQIDATVRWATSDLWPALAPNPLDDNPPDLTEVEQGAIDKVERSTSKLVTDTGRNEMIEAIVADKRARGYARITREGACYFCMMLATRGAVYDKHSFDKSNAKFTGAGNAKAHDEDHCTLQPIFSDHFEPSAAVREATDLYEQATKNVHGTKAKQKAWRRAYEGRADGREIAGKPRTDKGRRSSGSRDVVTKFDPTRDVDAGQSADSLKATLADLEASAKKFDSPGLKARRDDLRRKIAARG